MKNALANEWVAPTMKPVAIGAMMPITLFAKFMMPPTVPTPPRGATSDGSDQPTGAAAARPPSESVIQKHQSRRQLQQRVRPEKRAKSKPGSPDVR